MTGGVLRGHLGFKTSAHGTVVFIGNDWVGHREHAAIALRHAKPPLLLHPSTRISWALASEADKAAIESRAFFFYEKQEPEWRWVWTACVSRFGECRSEHSS